MSGAKVGSPPAAWPDALRGRITRYYTRYYRDALGIPGWDALVASRLDEESQEEAHLARVEALLGRPVRGLDVLNLGCGTGGFNVVARRHGAQVCGVDAEWDAVAIAADKARAAGGAVAAATGEALPFRDAAFDLVHCFSTIEHVASAATTIAEMLRVTRPGGAVYVHTPSALACYEAHYKLFWLPRMPRALARWYLGLRRRPAGFVDTLSLHTPGRLARLFRHAGARDVREAPAAAVPRETGSPLWPLIRAYYGLFRVTPTIELVARK
jgi:SAM-dependent methyltransferase